MVVNLRVEIVDFVKVPIDFGRWPIEYVVIDSDMFKSDLYMTGDAQNLCAPCQDPLHTALHYCQQRCLPNLEGTLINLGDITVLYND